MTHTHGPPKRHGRIEHDTQKKNMSEGEEQTSKPKACARECVRVTPLYLIDQRGVGGLDVFVIGRPTRWTSGTDVLYAPTPRNSLHVHVI
jgi:hypothetical protein